MVERRNVLSMVSKNINFLVPKSIGFLTYSGKSLVSEKSVFLLLSILKRRYCRPPLAVFSAAVNNSAARVSVVSKKIGGGSYRVPVFQPLDKQYSLSLSWIVKSYLSRKRSVFSSLSYGVFQTLHGKGPAIANKESIHKAAYLSRVNTRYINK